MAAGFRSLSHWRRGDMKASRSRERMSQWETMQKRKEASAEERYEACTVSAASLARRDVTDPTAPRVELAVRRQPRRPAVHYNNR